MLNVRLRVHSDPRRPLSLRSNQLHLYVLKAYALPDMELGRLRVGERCRAPVCVGIFCKFVVVLIYKPTR